VIKVHHLTGLGHGDLADRSIRGGAGWDLSFEIEDYGWRSTLSARASHEHQGMVDRVDAMWGTIDACRGRGLCWVAVLARLRVRFPLPSPESYASVPDREGVS
jgi:hypothetical protein